MKIYIFGVRMDIFIFFTLFCTIIFFKFYNSNILHYKIRLLKIKNLCFNKLKNKNGRKFFNLN